MASAARVSIVSVGLFALFVMAGCNTTRPLTPADYELLRDHVLAMDGEGRAIDVETEERLRTKTDAAIDRILDAAERKCATRPGGRCKLLIHVHGGLNEHAASAARARDAIVRIMAEPQDPDGDDWHYPVFVCWPSGFFESYGERLTLLRAGGHAPVVGPPSSPLFFLYDLGRGIVRLPVDAFYMLKMDFQVAAMVSNGWRFIQEWERAAEVEGILNLRTGGSDEPKFTVALGDYDRSFLAQTWRLLCYVGLLPLKIATTAVGLDGLGTGAWDGMLHRAHNGVWQTREFERDDVRHTLPEALARLHGTPTGAFALFMDRVDDRAGEPTRSRGRATAGGRPPVPYDLTLVGHSMGTILLNDILGLYPDLPVTDLVYMAAACSVREAEVAVVSFLLRHPEARFWQLTLHPIAEADEIQGGDLTARGSLLEWIDAWYHNQTHPLDRRLGKWNNVLSSLHVFGRVSPQVTVKGFAVALGKVPQEHGDFNLCPFWRRDFWDPKGGMSFDPPRPLD